MIKPASVFITAFFACLTASAANAQHHHRHHAQAIVVCDQRGCSDRATPHHTRDDANAAHADVNPVDANGNEAVIGGRPDGCPYEFCGCEASRYVFGEIRRELNLASAWIRKFPRTEPAPGMAAARNHHVMVLISHVSGRDWLVHDGNSGHHKTREHVRSIAGYVIVDPHGTRAASAERADAPYRLDAASGLSVDQQTPRPDVYENDVQQYSHPIGPSRNDRA